MLSVYVDNISCGKEELVIHCIRMVVWIALVGLLTTGCGGPFTKWTIDSCPRGLPVTLDNVEWGRTPCSVSYYRARQMRIVTVRPPTKEQWRNYQRDSGKIISTYIADAQTKTMRASAPEGTVFFNFVGEEYAVPETSEERIWLEAQMEDDGRMLGRSLRKAGAVAEPVGR